MHSTRTCHLQKANTPCLYLDFLACSSCHGGVPAPYHLVSGNGKVVLRDRLWGLHRLDLSTLGQGFNSHLLEIDIIKVGHTHYQQVTLYHSYIEIAVEGAGEDTGAIRGPLSDI